MKVEIKRFDVAMDIKNNGIELDVSDTKGKHLGDLYVTKTGLTWCNGRTRKAQGAGISWAQFIEYMNGK